MLLPLLLTLAADPSATAEYRRRVDIVRKTPGFVAFWDFVEREDGRAGSGRFAAHRGRGVAQDLRLDASNFVRDYWNEGREATYADFPLAGEGPFGQAVHFHPEPGRDFRPMLAVPRERIRGSRLDVHGPGKSVSLIAWLKREGGEHFIAGIWHEGIDTRVRGENTGAKREVAGMRQYALFAGLAANNGASAAHVSENGGSSFGDIYARNIAVTPGVIPADGRWSVVGMVFHNARDTVTSYLDGKADEYWIEDPAKHPFFRWPAKAWAEGSYRPPEAFARVRDVDGRRELAALRVNPFWFPHDLFSPPPDAGGPFSIGRTPHTGRNPRVAMWIGGVAVFDRALSPAEMAKLANVAPTLLKFEALK
ncbi:MAG: hypothetical protein SFV18_01305 [Bryobacteraceae bacterium]|nr:hypothetical protein [Bryobacteraceae bacterium]